jgi:hypothetical protein
MSTRYQWNENWAGTYVLKNVRYITQDSSTTPPTVVSQTFTDPVPLTITSSNDSVGSYTLTTQDASMTMYTGVGLANKLCDGTPLLQVANDVVSQGTLYASRVDPDGNVTRGTVSLSFMDFGETMQVSGLVQARFQRVFL